MKLRKSGTQPMLCFEITQDGTFSLSLSLLMLVRSFMMIGMEVIQDIPISMVGPEKLQVPVLPFPIASASLTFCKWSGLL
jgi:hypothetical protein